MYLVPTVAAAAAAAGTGGNAPGLQVSDKQDVEAADVVQRQNTGARHEEGVKHITPELREAASRANSVDEALHEFISAKFCDRLKEVGLLDQPLVANELATYELLDQRYICVCKCIVGVGVEFVLVSAPTRVRRVVSCFFLRLGVLSRRARARVVLHWPLEGCFFTLL